MRSCKRIQQKQFPSVETFRVIQGPVISITNGSVKVDGIELAGYIKAGSLIIKPSGPYNTGEVTVTFVSDRIQLDRDPADYQKEDESGR